MVPEARAFSLADEWCQPQPLDTMHSESAGWDGDRNNRSSTIDWQFTNSDTRIKLKRLYPKI